MNRRQGYARWTQLNENSDWFLTYSNSESLQQDSPKPSETGSSPKPEATQKLSALLLLSMFAITARFSEQEMPVPTNGKMWEAGRNYQESAKNILSEFGTW